VSADLQGERDAIVNAELCVKMLPTLKRPSHHIGAPMKPPVSWQLESVFKVIAKLTGKTRQQNLDPKPPKENWGQETPQTAREVHELFNQEDR
jgi:hypothetical protein